MFMKLLKNKISPLKLWPNMKMSSKKSRFPFNLFCISLFSTLNFFFQARAYILEVVAEFSVRPFEYKMGAWIQFCKWPFYILMPFLKSVHAPLCSYVRVYSRNSNRFAGESNNEVYFVMVLAPGLLQKKWQNTDLNKSANLNVTIGTCVQYLKFTVLYSVVFSNLGGSRDPYYLN